MSQPTLTINPALAWEETERGRHVTLRGAGGHWVGLLCGGQGTSMYGQPCETCLDDVFALATSALPA